MTLDPHAVIVQALHEFDCRGHGIKPWPIAETPHRAREYDARATAVLTALGPFHAAVAVEHDQIGYERRQIEAEEFGGAAPKPRRMGDPEYDWHPDTHPCPQHNDDGRGPLVCTRTDTHTTHTFAASAGINSKSSEPTGHEQ